MGTFRRTSTNQKCGGCDGPRGSAAERSYPSPKVRGGTESARLPQCRSGLEELPHVQGQGQQLRGATPCPRSGEVAEGTNPTSKEPWLHGCRRAKRSYSSLRSGGAA